MFNEKAQQRKSREYKSYLSKFIKKLDDIEYIEGDFELFILDDIFFQIPTPKKLKKVLTKVIRGYKNI